MKYVKKPIPVDAHQFHASDPMWPSGVYAGAVGWWIDTLEGKMEVKDRSYIVTGVKGEKWAVREDVFLETYEALLDLPPSPFAYPYPKEYIPGGPDGQLG